MTRPSELSGSGFLISAINFDEEISLKELFQSSEKLKSAAKISYHLASKLTDLLELRGVVQKAEEAAKRKKQVNTNYSGPRKR
jgi:hypothetical protein